MKKGIKMFFTGMTLVWFIVTVLMVGVLIAVNIVANYYSGVISLAIGGDRAIPIENSEEAMKYYERETKSKEEANANAFAITQEIAESGTILLKNSSSNGLPLAAGARVSVFGKNSVNLVYGGSGSGGGDDTFAKKDIFESLEVAGFNYNPTLKAFYENTEQSGEARVGGPNNAGDPEQAASPGSIATAETPQANYVTHGIHGSYSSDYKDAAIVVLSRIGGEGFDLPTGEAYGAKHYLDLDTNEKDLLAHVTASGFKKVVLVLNTLNNIEAGFIEELDKIDAALWIGGPGSTGIMALGKILNGSVSPSGRTVSTWAADFTLDPTWNNFADRNTENGNRYYNTTTGSNSSQYFVNYEESIYMGYRYYETRDYEEKLINSTSTWYKDNVVYALGYGLSYTTFDWEVDDSASINGVSITKDGNYEVSVKVSNTGAYKGRDVVQMYAKLPYTRGGVEKSYKVLAGFAKTPILYPTADKAANSEDAAGEGKPNSENVTITFIPYDIASYDYLGVSGFTGWVIEEGNYELVISTDAHTEKLSIPFSVQNDITYREDPATREEVVNRYTGQTDSAFNSNTMIKDSLMSRASFSTTFPNAPVDADRNADAAFLRQFNDVSHNNSEAATYVDMPNQGLAPTKTLVDLLYKDEDRGKWNAPYDGQDDAWNAVLDALTVNELASLYNEGGFKTNFIDSIKKPATLDSDGPVGWCNFIATDDSWKGNNAYTSQVVVAATWDFELAMRMGECVGEEALWGAVRSDGRTYSGWYSPGINLHRSPFSGRNFEYYSEDSFLSGKIASAVIQGCGTKGVYNYVKHFAVNDQETRRGGLATWVTEQALRELYLKPFEMAVKTGKTTAMMSSFNRIGTRWTGGDYRLLTEILRGEWGFKGMVICDYNTGGRYMNTKQMIYAGGDLNLATDAGAHWTDYDRKSAEDVSVLRMAAKNILYTVANSNAMNNLNYKYEPAIWKILLIVANIVIAVGLTAWGVFAIIHAYKKIHIKS